VNASHNGSEGCRIARNFSTCSGSSDNVSDEIKCRRLRASDMSTIHFSAIVL